MLLFQQISTKEMILKGTQSDIDGQNRNPSIEKTISTENSGLIKTEIYWGNVVKLTALHFGAFYGLYLCFTASKWRTLSWGTYTVPKRLVLTIFKMQFSFFSWYFWWIGNHCWGSSALEPPELQSQMASSPFACRSSNCCWPGVSIHKSF
jgi:hypothetical protein